MTEGGSTVDASLSCIFCRIIRGEASCYKVYEDEHAFAFLDINPLSHFHTLLIPKRCARTCIRIPTASIIDRHHKTTLSCLLPGIMKGTRLSMTRRRRH